MFLQEFQVAEMYTYWNIIYNCPSLLGEWFFKSHFIYNLYQYIKQIVYKRVQ
jgi:hypothetical protein